ncbi:MAG: DUF4254 domain-containing protein [Candidatus Omnitrophica bacterium]|nr:DUF4254 domain-containing protein [Candidatus Omnitrophota bacterium]
MAETLGSLIDKLTIKSLREFHIHEMIRQKNKKFSRSDLLKKLKILTRQKRTLDTEIEEFISLALNKKTLEKDEKLKLYNKVSVMDNVGKVRNLAHAIEKLGQKNIELWHLEDEARREDVDLSFIGSIKRKIDVANQQRNDCIDLIDEMFEKCVVKMKEKQRKK